MAANDTNDPGQGDRAEGGGRAAGEQPEGPMHANSIAVRDAGRDAGLDITVVTYPDGTRTAADAATAIGCDVAQIVKSLIFLVDGELTLALVSGANQLDEKKLAAAAGGAKTGRANADQVREATGFSIGGVPPFGHRRRLPVFIDPDLLAFDEVWAAAGTPHTVFCAAPQALVAATKGTVVALRKG